MAAAFNELSFVVKRVYAVGVSETGSPAERHHHLDSLMPTTTAGVSLSAEAEGLLLCGRWRVTVPRVFHIFRPSQSIDPNSQHSLLSLSDNDLLLRRLIEAFMFLVA